MQQIYRSTPISKCDFNKVTKQLYWNHTSAWAIHKTRNTGMGNGMQGTRGMFTRIPGNLLEDSRECFHFSIPGNVREDSGECSSRFRGIVKKIPVNLNFDLLWILLVFHQISLLNCFETIKHNNYWAILLKKTFSSLHLNN